MVKYSHGNSIRLTTKANEEIITYERLIPDGLENRPKLKNPQLVSLEVKKTTNAPCSIVINGTDTYLMDADDMFFVLDEDNPKIWSMKVKESGIQIKLTYCW